MSLVLQLHDWPCSVAPTGGVVRSTQRYGVLVAILVSLISAACRDNPPSVSVIDSSVAIIDSVPSCPNCIALERHVTLQIASPSALTGVVRVAAGPRGQLALLHSSRLDPIVLLFDREGRLLKQFGRKGTGPGEFDMPISISFLQSGELAVTNQSGRINLFRGDGTPITDLRFEVRSPHLLGVSGVGGWIAVGSLPTSNSFGKPLHVLDSEGSVTASFGTRSPLGRLSQTDGTRRVASIHGDSIALLLELDNYLVELVRLSTGASSRIGVRSPWMLREPITSSAHLSAVIGNTKIANLDNVPEADYLPENEFQAVWADTSFNIWTSVRAPRESWRHILSRARRLRPGATLELDSLIQTGIDVFNPTSRSLIARKIVDMPLRPIGKETWSLEVRSDAVLQRVEIWKARLSSSY